MGNEGGGEGTNHVEQIFAWLRPLAVPGMGILDVGRGSFARQRHVKSLDSGLTVEGSIYAGQEGVFLGIKKR